MHVSVVALESMVRRPSGQLHMPRECKLFCAGAISSAEPTTSTGVDAPDCLVGTSSCSRPCCKYHVATRGLLIDRGAVGAKQNMTLESGRQHNAQRMRYQQRDLLRPALCVYTRNRPLKWSQPQSMCSSLRPGGRPRQGQVLLVPVSCIAHA